VIILFNLNGVAQPAPFRGTLLFNLTEKEHTGTYLRIEDFKTEKVQLLSYNKESKLKYDSINKAFSFTTNGSVMKNFAIVYKKDTVFISYPSLRYLKALSIVMPIPLNGKSFSFYTKYTYDAIHSNESSYFNNIYNLCHGCFISDTYSMSEEEKKEFQVNRKFLTKIEIVE
jgi:hypothetical protein